MAGGLERQLVRVASELSKLGFKTIILSYDNEPSSLSITFLKILDG